MRVDAPTHALRTHASRGIGRALARETLRLSTRWAFSPRVSPRRQRVRTDLVMRRPGAPRGTRISLAESGGVRAEELVPPGSADGGPVLLYLHGGGYVVGSPLGYRWLAGSLAAALGARAIVPDYRLAPEHPAPAALDDARAAYEGARPPASLRNGSSWPGTRPVAASPSPSRSRCETRAGHCPRRSA
jgi:acetyl esterase/lipase